MGSGKFFRHRTPNSFESRVVKKDNGNHNNRITNDLYHVYALLKHDKGNGKIEDRIQVKENSNSSGINSVKCEEIQEQWQNGKYNCYQERIAVKAYTRRDLFYKRVVK